MRQNAYKTIFARYTVADLLPVFLKSIHYFGYHLLRLLPISSLQDCEEVFRFYEAEYAKMLERWEKVKFKYIKAFCPSQN